MKTKKVEKWCSKCEEKLLVTAFAEHASRHDGLSAYCHECHNEYHRAKNKKYSELSPGERFKANVRSKLKMRVRRGLVIKATHCTNCGSNKNIEAHHENYDKPYEVVWLCRGCHNGIHQS